MDLTALAALSRQIADPAEDCVILGEGNTSALGGPGTMHVKASGMELATIDEHGFVTIDLASTVGTLDGPPLSDEETARFLASVVVPSSHAGKPSTEAFMHAYLLSLPGIARVVHTHPTALLPLLCRPDCERIAEGRLFPDEIVCCGPRPCVVPFADPGLPLAQEIRRSVSAFVDRSQELPKTIWLRNHGLICIGATASEVVTATRMSVKAARIWLGVLQTGVWPTVLTEEQVERIHRRPDEHYRQRLLWKQQ